MTEPSVQRRVIGDFKKGIRVKVLVLNADRTPLMPCWPNRAHELIRRGRASLYRRVPKTIILHEQFASPVLQEIELRIDPGSKTTGLALIMKLPIAPESESAEPAPITNDTVVFAMNLSHRGAAIKKKLEQRRALRSGRRSRQTRYRKARFDNRTRREGWLPPSLASRVENVRSWALRLQRLFPISSIAVETVRFDMQKILNPEISGIEYQQGTLLGYEIREYLLEKWGRTCAYCDATNVPVQIDHIVPRARHGSNRISNLTLACEPCNNNAKKNQRVEDFLAHDPARLAAILAQCKQPLRDAAAVNATRYAIGNALKQLRLPLTFWSGGRTKMNRIAQGYAKDHWIDAACVGESGAKVAILPKIAALVVKAIGRGSRQMCKPDRYGFPRTAAKRAKRVHGFQTGDLVELRQPTGKYAGHHRGTITIRARGDFDITTILGKITARANRFTLLQRSNGYAFA